MNQVDFQDEVIDRLARIETKQDATSQRVDVLEAQVDDLRQAHSESRGANRLLMAASGLTGTAVGSALPYLLRR